MVTVPAFGPLLAISSALNADESKLGTYSEWLKCHCMREIDGPTSIEKVAAKVICVIVLPAASGYEPAARKVGVVSDAEFAASGAVVFQVSE